jgi:pilus assembly protein Flp/PilA
MKSGIKTFYLFCQEEDGVALSEYLILLGLLVGGSLIAVELAGNNLSAAWGSWETWWTDTVPALADNGQPVCCANAQAANVPGNCCN